MKRLILILMIFLVPLKIYAQEEIYSEYSNFSEYSENEIIENELTNVETETRYLWYKNTEQLGEYKIYNEDEIFSNDCYYSEFSEWSSSLNQTSDMNIESRTLNDYTLSYQVRYIHITNTIGSYENFRIPEIDIMYNDTELNYTIECEGCYENFYTNISNGIYDTNEAFIKNGGQFILDLNGYYPVNQIKVLMYIFDMGATNSSYVINYSSTGGDFYGIEQINMNRELFWGSGFITNTHNITTLDKSFWTFNHKSYESYDENYIVENNQTTEYRYQNKYCKPILKTNETNNIYSKEPIGEYNIKGEEKIYYRSQTREKIILDELIITDYDYNLNNFIKETTEPLELTSNLNINQNGTYNLNIKSESFNIDREINVDIKDNIIKDYEQTIKDLNTQLTQLENDINKEKETYEQEISDLKKQLEQYSEQLKQCEENCDSLEQCINDLENQIKDLTTNHELTLKDYSDKINENLIKIEEYENELKNKTVENESLKLNNQNLLDEIEFIKLNHQKINNEIITYYESEMKVIETIYRNKVEELETQLKTQNEEIFNVTTIKDETISNLNNEINQLKNEMETKSNDYLLQIDNLENISMIAGIILFLILLLLLLIQKMSKRKKH